MKILDIKTKEMEKLVTNYWSIQEVQGYVF